MDRLAAEGVSFDRAYANCPICTPSRGTIFSGRHAHSGPVQYFFDVYKAGAPSTATALRAAGYHTAYFGKWHCGVVQDQEPPVVRAEREEYTRWPHRTPEYHRAGFQDWYGLRDQQRPHLRASIITKTRPIRARWTAIRRTFSPIWPSTIWSPMIVMSRFSLFSA